DPGAREWVHSWFKYAPPPNHHHDPGHILVPHLDRHPPSEVLQPRTASAIRELLTRQRRGCWLSAAACPWWAGEEVSHPPPWGTHECSLDACRPPHHRTGD